MTHATVTVTFEEEVEVELDQFDTDDLIEELESRGEVITQTNDDMQELFHALKFGMNDRALEIARRIAQNTTGRIL